MSTLLIRAELLGTAFAATHRGPEPGGFADRFLHRSRPPTQLAGRLAAVDVGFGAHHAHRIKAEFGVLAGKAGPQAAEGAKRVEHRHGYRMSRRRHPGLVGHDPDHV